MLTGSTGLTDRDERDLLTAAENRIAEPLRVGAALAAVLAAARPAVRRLLRRERESVTCHPTAPHQPISPLPR
ncbi:hypothetical protein ACFRJ1_25020 [Streptomyces sp. NPDC056773]|uniref:hypothetical protein n=1 Tax=unclassified Streptomyces TaxID=2593676 RepID=UPI0036A00F64